MWENPKMKMIDVVSDLEHLYNKLEEVSKDTSVDMTDILSKIDNCITHAKIKTNEVLNQDLYIK